MSGAKGTIKSHVGHGYLVEVIDLRHFGLSSEKSLLCMLYVHKAHCTVEAESIFHFLSELTERKVSSPLPNLRIYVHELTQIRACVGL